MRGDHFERLDTGAELKGPPPHARGPQGLRPVGEQGGGTTPACAGTTGECEFLGGLVRDHPRMRGDHRPRTPSTSHPAGPPPHARGPPGGTRVHRRPAVDHPRMRGDHRHGERGDEQGAGPPPHARGPRRRSGAGSPGSGTTPACAGTTVAMGCPPSGGRDHPRMRGDHDEHRHAEQRPEGPPPHARGPQAQRVGRPTTRGDHPRMRGDHSSCTACCVHSAGPPPHARGPRLLRPARGSAPGTTPACAGTTGRSDRRAHPRWDHPRMRGDHAGSPPAAVTTRGPPPHARGPPEQRPAGHRRDGTTPACAGTTTSRATARPT